jgi:3-oxoacyl-[acyl-carrier-protein] synthase-3
MESYLQQYRNTLPIIKGYPLQRSRIIATGSCHPEKILTNSDLEKMVDTSDEWITERTGIKERRIAGKNQAASDLAYSAAKSALERAGMEAQSLDLIIVATVSGDMPMPSTACMLQQRLSAVNAAGFDVNAACSGFLYGLHIADGFIRSGMHRKVLVVGTEVLSRVTDWDDRTTCVIFGDGAGAVIVEPSEGESGIIAMKIRSDGRLWELLNIPGGGSRFPASEETVRQKLHYIKMKGNETFKIAVRMLEDIALKTLEENNLKPVDLSLMIPHQANQRIIQATAERLNLPMEKVIMNLDRYGNTSAASIPIALDEAVTSGKVKEGDIILLEAFGGGLTWGSALIKW